MSKKTIANRKKRCIEECQDNDVSSSHSDFFFHATGEL